jgi:hypothetical protein
MSRRRPSVLQEELPEPERPRRQGQKAPTIADLQIGVGSDRARQYVEGDVRGEGWEIAPWIKRRIAEWRAAGGR